jgi:glycosyltransferase involved in cell wall biosynthesis
MSPLPEPSVAVIVAARDAEDTIDECVRSLLELRYPAGGLELCFVDNGSSDATAVILGRYGDRVRLLHESRRGAAAARNAGISATESEVVAFTDADCTVHPDWARHLVAALADTRAGVAGGTILAREPANDVERFGQTIHDHHKAIEVYEPPYAITMSWASPRAVIEGLGGFDERFTRCQDVDLSFRILQAGHELAFAPEAIVHHRNEPTLPRLFQEGFTHGFHGVRARKRHEQFLRRFGHGRLGRPGYGEIAGRFVDWARGREPGRASCDAVFNSGKKAGKLLGSARFGHLDL